MKYAKKIIGVFTVAAVFVLVWYFNFGVEITSPKLYALHVPVEEKSNTTTTLIAVGDIMPGRTVEQKMLQYNDWTYPFKETYQVTTTGDIIFGNLESPLTEGPVVPAGSLVFRASPQTTTGLQFGGFNVVSLANNHMKNQGTKGIQETIAYLDQAGIKHAGAGLTDSEARQPTTIEINGIKFSFLAYTDSSFTPNSYEAAANRSGSPFMNEQQLIEDINSLKNNADVIIISMHAGTEYSSQPNQKQIDFAHTAIDNGAKLVIGHHPHVVQPMEEYKNGYIFYSLGNFVFDQMWSEATRESAIAVITFGKIDIENIELVPIKIFDYSQPRVLSDLEGQSIISRMTGFTF